MTQGEAQEVDPLVGKTVAGKYHVVKQLGEGGMGCVYLAEQKLGTSVRKVALKTLHKHLSHDAQIKARFDREAGTVAALEHPNTIQVYDFGEMEDGTLYLVMEFVQGRSVADILEKDGAMPPARVENILRQVCGSLEEAHGHGIVHRDLKPDNVVLCERAGTKDWVEVLDFGIAKRSSEHDPNEAKLTQQGMVLGTPPYMSPEQFTGQPVDLRSDIYALGVMTYEMLVGKYPFEANTAWEWASKHMTEAPRPIETQALGANVPERMRHAITRALAKNKDERFASVKEFYEALRSDGAAAPHTSVMSSAPGQDHHAPTSMNGGAISDPGGTSGVGGGPPRAKTEMGEPMMGGGPPAGAMTPPYGAGMGGPPMGSPPMGSPPMGGAPMGAAASVPQGPQHQAAKKSGGSGLIIGLAVLAVVLIGGGITAYALKGKPKPVPEALDLGTASATAPVESAAGAGGGADVDAAVATADPLGGTTTAAPLGKVVTNAATGTGAAHTAAGVPTPTPKGTPVPTPKGAEPPPPPKADPPICKSARLARAKNSPAAPGLEASCRGAGGQL
jgi:tRNA A-37 threonylcarbamoyl transferase component Bud32